MNFELFKRLLLTPGVPGREHRIRELIRDEVDGLFDEVRADAMGSLVCVKRPKKRAKGKPPLRVMLAAHMDQIGFIVRHVDDKGFVRVVPVGGFDTRNLFARLVTISPDLKDPKQDLPGVMNPGGKPIHIATEEEKKKIPEVADFLIDLGIPAEEVKAKVRIGDMVTLRAPVTRIGNTVVSQAIDNRVACWIVIEAIRQLKEHACEIACVFTVQEEVGLRGALTAAYDADPQVGIAVDTTLCVDTPGVPDHERTTVQAAGAALTFMDGASIGDLDLVLEFERVANEKKIKTQRSILARGGTDAGAIQRARSGVRSFTLSCPTRYIHTVTEMVHVDDMTACRDVLAAYLAQA